MSTITTAEFTLDDAEIEALREAAFGSLLGHDYEGILERPQHDEGIPDHIGKSIGMASRINRFVDVLRTAEAGRVEPWVLEDPNEVRALVSLLEDSALRLASQRGERDRAGEDAAEIKLALAGTRSLMTRLRAREAV